MYHTVAAAPCTHIIPSIDDVYVYAHLNICRSRQAILW